MDAGQFGQLVKALRTEQFDLGPPQEVWSQERLADEARLSLHTIQRIEQGRLKKLDPDILISLATVLELNAGERKEFIFAASGLRNRQLVPEVNDPQTAVRHCLHRLENLYVPAAAHDPFLDIVAFNRAGLFLYNLQNEDYLGWKNLDPPLNVLHTLYTKNPLGVEAINSQAFQQMALRLVASLRVFSLQHRANPYFSKLLADLKRYKGFSRLWQEAKTEGNEFIFGLPFYVNYWGITIVASIIPIESTHGTLRIVVYSPANEDSLRKFEQLMQRAGVGVIETSRWPDKPPYPP